MSLKFNVPIFKALLVMRKIRQWQVANAANIDPSYLSKICQGKLIPRYPLVVKIAAVLGVKPEELILNSPAESSRPSGWKASLNLRRKNTDLPFGQSKNKHV